MAKIVIYGAYGYTGKLIVNEAQILDIDVTLAGRSEEKLKVLATETGYDYKAVSLNDETGLTQLLRDALVVIHCAGPFQHTAQAMAEACIKTGTHYLDITGEYQVFELLQTYSKKAAEAGIMLLPGAGFDVVPSDCLAAGLKAKLPDASSLQLAFATTGGGLSRGTSKTMVEGAGEGHIYRTDGKLRSKPLGQVVKHINYGAFERLSVGISWGDISSAYYSTGIPDIEVFTGTHEKQIKSLRWAHHLQYILKIRWIKNYLKKQVDKKPAGPSDEKRANSKTYLWGKVTNKQGDSHEAWLQVPNGYTLTAHATILFSQKILNDEFTPGYQTPSTAYGKDVILELNDCHFTGF